MLTQQETNLAFRANIRELYTQPEHLQPFLEDSLPVELYRRLHHRRSDADGPGGHGRAGGHNPELAERVGRAGHLPQLR